jgi:tetratricopeptide (TPR) repeat protein
MNRQQRRAHSKLAKQPNKWRESIEADDLSPVLTKALTVGLEHHRAGRLAEAEACYRRIIADCPRSARTLYNLGVVLHDQGKLDDAVAAYRQAVSVKGNVSAFHANLGHALRKLGKLEEATTALYEAVRIEPDNGEMNFNLGVVLRDRGMLKEAAVALRKAALHAPKKAEAHYDLAIVLHNLGRLDDAIAAYRKAIGVKPNFADAHNGLGTALMDAGQLPEARKSLERAVKLVPDNARYRRGVSIITRFSARDHQLDEIEQLVASGHTRSIEDQIELRFALGKAYDDVGRYADAFQQWSEGNALKRRTIEYDETTTFEEFDRVQAVFTAELIRSAGDLGHPSRLPIFIVGMPRSGTTLVEQIIASHASVFGGGELPYFKSSVEAATARLGGSALGKEGLRKIATTYLAQLEQLAARASRVTDKLPRNFIFAGLIHLTFPNAPIISVTRDPIDTCLSCFSILFGEEQDFTYDLAELGRYHRHYQALMRHWHQVLPPGRVLEVRYEDVVTDLEGQARRIISHCGLEWDPKCLSFYKTRRPVRTASTTQVRQPIYNNAIGRWRTYAEWLGPLLGELENSANTGTNGKRDSAVRPF